MNHEGSEGPDRRRRRNRKRRRPQRLLVRWEQVAVRLREAANIALFLDFDGTLAPLHRDPKRVSLDEPTRQRLRRLARHPRVTVYFISGRRRRDLIRRVSVRGAAYLGLHGLETGAPVASLGVPRRSISRARRELAARLAGLPKVWIEDKVLSFVVHYRGAPRDVIGRARSLLREYLSSSASLLRMLEGKRVWEVLPREVEGKGKAVKDALAGLPDGVLPIYVGDDTTDESAFSRLKAGVTVRVGLRKSTRAKYLLRDPAEVKQFLSRLEAELS
ncbi:MAG TPA: trehalose-phosphatase [Terriglobia bacterium]|nr:trehalose-phosphatase [Terriglobia bacterium]